MTGAKYNFASAIQIIWGEGFAGLAILLMLAASASIGTAPAAAATTPITVTLNVGDRYVIHGVDSNSLASVSHTDNSNSFIVKRTAPTELTVFTFQKGEGTIATRSQGEEVIYHLIVNGIADSSHPLRPGIAPPALGGAGSEISSASTPAGAPASHRIEANTGNTAADDGSADDGDDDAASAETAIPAPAGAGAKVAASRATPATSSGVAATSTAASADKESSGITPKIEEAASNSSDNSSGYVGDGSAAPPRTAAATTAYLPAGVSQQQLPPIKTQYYSSNPPSPGPQGYITNRTFGGHHALPPDEVSIPSGTSQVYDLPEVISRVSIANSRVADVEILGSNQLMVIGRQPGFTTLVVWDQAGDYIERQIWTENAGHQQVLLHVIVAEIDLNKLQEQGVDFAAAMTNAGVTIASLTGAVATPFTASSGGIGPISPPPGGGSLPLLFSQLSNFIITAHNSGLDFYGFVHVLEEHDLGKILARPELLANSGEKARFLSGGEIPIVIAQQLTTSIVFKQYGTSVIFIPTVIGSHDVGLVVRSEVSEPDFANGVQEFGFKIPAFVTRRAQTRVRLKDNHTLIIAGLIQNQSRSTIRKIPYLGDVPYLGGLFRSTTWNHEKTELVMSVTPEIVRAIPPNGEVELPTSRGPLTAQEVLTRPVVPPDVTRPRIPYLYVPFVGGDPR